MSENWNKIAGGVVPRRGSVDPSAIESLGGPQKQNRTAVRVVPRRGSLGASLQQTSASVPIPAAGSLVEYAVTFDAREPLGFYCITEKKGDSDVCKIISVDPHVKGKDERLHEGTIVLSAAFVEGSLSDPIKIRSHVDLKKHYLNAKKRTGAKLRLSFINTDVKAAGPSRTRNKDWKSSGAWQGKTPVPGFAGGAAIATYSEKVRTAADPNNAKKRKLGSETQTAHRGSSPPVISDGGGHQENTKSVARPGMGDSQVLVVLPDIAPRRSISDPLPSRDRRPGPSILRKSRVASTNTAMARVEPGMFLRSLTGMDSKSKNRVAFTQTFDVREYQIGSYSTDFALRPEGSTMDTTSPPVITTTLKEDTTLNASSKVPHVGELKEAILDKDYKDVIRILYAGVSREEQGEAKALIKDKLLRLKSGKRDRDAANKVRDLELKRKAIAIVVQSHFVIERVRSMKKSIRCQLDILRIENLQVS